MAWFKKTRRPIAGSAERVTRIPEGLWVKCPGCTQIIYTRDLAANLQVCPKCAHHLRVGAVDRVNMLLDEGWVEHDPDLVSLDPLAFTDTKGYEARLAAGSAATGLKDAVVVASGVIERQPAVMASISLDKVCSGRTMERSSRKANISARPEPTRPMIQASW